MSGHIFSNIGNEFIVVREGTVKTHMYYIPKQYINNYTESSVSMDGMVDSITRLQILIAICET